MATSIQHHHHQMQSSNSGSSGLPASISNITDLETLNSIFLALKKELEETTKTNDALEQQIMEFTRSLNSASPRTVSPRAATAAGTSNNGATAAGTTISTTSFSTSPPTLTNMLNQMTLSTPSSSASGSNGNSFNLSYNYIQDPSLQPSISPKHSPATASTPLSNSTPPPSPPLFKFQQYGSQAEQPYLLFRCARAKEYFAIDGTVELNCLPYKYCARLTLPYPQIQQYHYEGKTESKMKRRNSIFSKIDYEDLGVRLICLDPDHLHRQYEIPDGATIEKHLRTTNTEYGKQIEFRIYINAYSYHYNNGKFVLLIMDKEENTVLAKTQPFLARARRKKNSTSG